MPLITQFTDSPARIAAIASTARVTTRSPVVRVRRWGATLLPALLVCAGCASVTTPPSQTASPPATADRAEPPALPGARTATVRAANRERRPDGDTAAPVAQSDAPVARWTPDSSLWDRIRAGFALDALNSPLVAEKERFYTARPEALQQMFQRGGRYLFHIVEELEARGMPTELALLPFVESAMNPTAMSPARASGLWQFIPSTGKAYDLHQNWWVDNRRDPVKSTAAALDYLQKIHAMNGDDWFLALASYNWGEGSVAKAVRKAQARGLSGDYLSLDMPNETRHYVPKLIALKNILLRADELGIALPVLRNRPYFVTIEKTRPIDLKLAAQFAGMSLDEFLTLNPAHNRPVIAASRNNQIKLPAERKDAFLAAVAQHEQARQVFATWQPYTLKHGETLTTVAQRAGVGTGEILRANGLKDNQRIVAGTRILAPHAVVEDETRVEDFVAPRVYEQVERPAVYHTVGHKESLSTICQRYGISAATLTAWNGLKQGVRRGMRLLVQPAATQTLLTNEQGNRSVVASEARPAIVRTVFVPDENRNDAVKGRRTAAEPAAAPAASAARRSAVVSTRAPAGRHGGAAQSGLSAQASQSAQSAQTARSPRAAASMPSGTTARRADPAAPAARPTPGGGGPPPPRGP